MQITTCVLLLGSKEVVGDSANLVRGQCYSSGDDPVEVFHCDGSYPLRPLDVEDGPRVREDDGAVEPESIRVSLSQERLDPSDIAGQLYGRVSEFARIGFFSFAHLDLRPDPVSVENEAPMVFHLEDEESEGADKNAIDVGHPSVPARREVVVGGMFITQPQRTKMIPQNPLSLYSAMVCEVSGTVPSHDETGHHQGAPARRDDKCDAHNNPDNEKGQGEDHPRQADRQALLRFLLKMVG